MATILVVPNDIEQPLHLGDLYTHLKPHHTLVIQRPVAYLPRLRSLKQAMASNQVAVGVTLTDQERSTIPHDADLFAEERK